jgi:molecular chaperone HtpG
MTTTSNQTSRSGVYQVDFASLIKVLGVNLYSNPKATIRELIQNASDSCVRRAAVLAAMPNQAEAYTPFIRIWADSEAGTLTFEDNGAGMVQEEVIRYLASIGAGRTREERQRLSTSDQAAAAMLIGQFGVGFLSAFVVADKVIVDTLALTDQARAVHWVCEGSAEYVLSQGEARAVGTTITLFLKDASYDLLEAATLKEAVVRYADFIAFPIYLNGSNTPVNLRQAPWHKTDATNADYIRYIEHRYGVTPLACTALSVEQAGLAAKGVLFIPPQGANFKRRLRSTDIFQRRMYIGEDLNILPEWAEFVCAVVDSPSLELVASREAVMTAQPSYWSLHNYLEGAVTSFISEIAQHQQAVFKQVIEQHEWQMLLGATRNNLFFDQVKDLIPLLSDMGKLTLPDYLERVPAKLGNFKTIYYLPEKQKSGQQQSSLFRAQGIPIYIANAAVEQFLQRYAEQNDDVTLRQMVSGVIELMEIVSSPEWHFLEERFAEIDILARAVKFYPTSTPAMAVRQPEYDSDSLLDQLISGRRGLFDFIERAGRETADAYTLCFNVDNPLIQKLATYRGDQNLLIASLRAIQASALLIAGVELDVELAQQVAVAQTQIIELALNQA